MAAAPAALVTPRPNIILIVVDDMRFDEFGAAGHPWLETPNIDRLAREGAMFTQMVHAIPLCSPNRATILTGQYPARHGVTGNEARSELSHRLATFPRALQGGGYRTGFVGKWHMGNDPTPRPGFDYWVSFPGQGTIIDPPLYENGALTPTKGYVTDLLTDRALTFLDSAARQPQPFFLYVAHKAIHPDIEQRNDGSLDLAKGSRFIPAPRHAGRYADKPVPRRPNYLPPGKVLPGDSQVSVMLTRKYAAETGKKYGVEIDASTSDATVRSRAEMLLSIDDGLGRILARLENDGLLDNTVIILTSDNGYFYGEHGLSVERRMPYEEGIKSPLLVRFPPRVASGVKVDALVSSVDIAPTILDFAGVGIGTQVQGRSFVPALTGRDGAGRADAYVEYNGDEVFDWTDDASYRAIRTRRYKLIHWVQHPERDEFYDLEVDPYEMTNRIAEPRYRSTVVTLERRLKDASAAAAGL